MLLGSFSFPGVSVRRLREEEELVLTEEGEESRAEETAEASPEEPEEEPQEICVDLGGAVANPGVYFLEEGSRLYQAVEMAGGFTPEAAVSALNQAQILSDGQQIRVPTQEEVENQPELAETGNGTDVSQGAGGKVNINTADAQELMTLNGSERPGHRRLSTTGRNRAVSPVRNRLWKSAALAREYTVVLKTKLQ